ncbi:polyubiquitin-like [Melia azedarach]|uniref:Polyubiquitin-like n=1 Tax=Melia azedarach TaxID=155640 RepID=A0ACC1YJB5_MELAZ|nr:polyubiquitin-like [Melia azedarach]
MESSTHHLNSPQEEMNLYLKIIKTVELKVKKGETVENLKAMLHEKEGISEDIQDLFFAGDRLKDGRLIDYGIQNNNTLNLILHNPNGIKLFVKLPKNHATIVVESMAHHTVKTIKSLIQVKEGIQSDQFALVYDGNLLEEDLTLASLNIKSESNLHLIFCPKEVVSISVKAPTGDTVKLKVKILFTVHDVKAIVGSIIAASVSDHIMVYEGKQLEDCKTLSSCDIIEECTLKLLPASIQIFVKTPTEEILKLKIFVKTWSGKTITLDVKPCDTIKAMKGKLFQKLQIPIDIHNIVFAGKRLEENQDLGSYNIQKHSTVHMVLAPSSKFIRLPLSAIDPSISQFTSISDLRDMAKIKFQAPIKELLFSKVALEDSQSLADYGMDLTASVDIVV